MKRRDFLRLATTVSGGIAGAWLVGSGEGDYLLHSLQVMTLTHIPTLSSLPRIIPRQEWGARPIDHNALEEKGFASSANPNGWYVYQNDLRNVYRTVVVHHSGQMLITNQTMSDIQALQMDINHWADIGYHYGIDNQGKIFEGRNIYVRGSSVEGHNTGVLGVVVMGDFERERPLNDQLATLQTLLNWLTAQYQLTHLAGHNEFNPETECPGRHLSLYLNLLAKGAGLKRGTQGYVSPSKPNPDNPTPAIQEF